MKCPHCGERIVKYPLKNEEGCIIWQNLFKMDLQSALFLFAVIMLLLAYAVNTKECREIIENPCENCENRLGIADKEPGKDFDFGEWASDESGISIKEVP